MAIYMTARFQVHAESRSRCEQSIRDFVAYVREHEPHTRLYTSVQETGNAIRFLHFFIFTDEAARDAHSNSAAVQRFTAVLYPECVTPVEFTEYALVASTAKQE